MRQGQKTALDPSDLQSSSCTSLGIIAYYIGYRGLWKTSRSYLKWSPNTHLSIHPSIHPPQTSKFPQCCSEFLIHFNSKTSNYLPWLTIVFIKWKDFILLEYQSSNILADLENSHK